jgi:hypothetical protein
VPFSFAEDLFGTAQPVGVQLGGFKYPGEVIVAAKWEPRLGEPLAGVSMFRVVLLQSSTGPDSNELVDKRICVAVQADSAQGGTGRDDTSGLAEARSIYNVADAGAHNGNGTDTVEKSDAEADVLSLREVRKNYVTANDPELNRLVSALVEHETKVNGSLIGNSHELWKSGEIVVSSKLDAEGIEARQIFLLSEPESWIEVVAIALLTKSNLFPTGVTSTEIFDELRLGRVKSAKEKLRLICGLYLSEPTPIDTMSVMLDSLGRRTDPVLSRIISGEELTDLLIHKLMYPPEIALLWVIAAALEFGAEIELERQSGERQYVSGEYIFEFQFKDVSFERISVLRADKSDNWDAVLPFLQLVSPHTFSTRYGGGRESDAQDFTLQLASVHDRIRQALPIMQSLEVATGSIDRPLTRNSTTLLNALGASSWQEYVSQARNVFGSVAALRKMLSDAALHWATVESAPEIERAIYYLDQAEFGRIDHVLAVERQLLRSRFDLQFLIEAPTNWLSIRDEFERWRQDYRRAYLEDHAEKQEYNLLIAQKIEQASERVEQIELLSRIDAIRIESEVSPAELWSETIMTFTVCDFDGSEILLIDEPVCVECRGRLGQPTNHTDVTDMISEIDRIFLGYRDRLASVVSAQVLDSNNSDKLQSLFRLNSAGDLSDLANVLDDKVISFLNELFGKTQ